MEITVWIERQLRRTHRRYRRRDCDIFPESRKDPLGLIGFCRECILHGFEVPIYQESRSPTWSSLLALLYLSFSSLFLVISSDFGAVRARRGVLPVDTVVIQFTIVTSS